MIPLPPKKLDNATIASSRSMASNVPSWMPSPQQSCAGASRRSSLSHIDTYQWERLREVERLEKESIDRIAIKWGGSAPGLGTNKGSPIDGERG